LSALFAVAKPSRRLRWAGQAAAVLGYVAVLLGMPHCLGPDSRHEQELRQAVEFTEPVDHRY
jgi:hypothetical protein